MKQQNSAEFKAKVNAYLCESAMDFEGTEAETAKHIFDRFTSEYDHQYNRKRWPNHQKRVSEWLAGLALNIDYTYHDISKTWAKWHECELTEEQSEKIQDRWFSVMAMKVLQLWTKHGLEVA